MKLALKKYKILEYNKPINTVIKRCDAMIPVNLANFDELIQELHLLYPKKTELEIELIIRSFFKAMRHFLLQSEIVSLVNFLPKIFLTYAYKKIPNGTQILNIKTVVSTADKIRYWMRYEK